MDDSFAIGQMANLLEGPVYTKPAVWRELEVPEVLRSGNHAAIDAWRKSQAEARTAQYRPDLLSD
jgi:tRNA (guanine37-N1)-methyltransferase